MIIVSLYQVGWLYQAVWNESSPPHDLAFRLMLASPRTRLSNSRSPVQLQSRIGDEIDALALFANLTFLIS